ncbi:SHOCT domain-containing protein [Mycobacterium sp. ACS4331]|uniref:SHOCT domain-containing protein n=1 Tax=Mycobacterium sp. ACS4331 TaxID=1834121 RepID=UPI0008022DDD|nr:SHOCT domain-containing protein [Mycobacterium sp. ACS4331]OBF16730.1 hypothetical protein A5727_12530 [Mycobacterium sp. ACS4331]
MIAGFVSIVVSFIGFVASLLLNAFVFDDYDAYGEVPIPGSAALHLPAGDVTISFHTVAIGSPSGALPIPDLRMNLRGPGGQDPEVTENIGSTTTVNNDMRRRVWVAHIPAEGVYEVETDGEVGAFVRPTLAFGSDGGRGWLPWVFVAIFANGMIDLVIAGVWLSRIRRREQLAAFNPSPAQDAVSATPAQSYTPTDDGVRIEALRNLAALRDSGALTEDEFQAEKRRVLDGM